MVPELHGAIAERMHDGQHFLEKSDATRIPRTGEPMTRRAVVIYVKGDWSEYGSTFGLATWQNSVRPCFLCNAEPSNLYDTVGLGMCSFPCTENTDADCEDACARCEHRVVLSEIEYNLLVTLLKYDKRDGAIGVRGLGIQAPGIPHLGI